MAMSGNGGRVAPSRAKMQAISVEGKRGCHAARRWKNWLENWATFRGTDNGAY